MPYKHEITHVFDKHRKGIHACIFYCYLLPLLLMVGLFEKLEFSRQKCQVEDLKESMACSWFSTLVRDCQTVLAQQEERERRCSVQSQKHEMGIEKLIICLFLWLVFVFARQFSICRFSCSLGKFNMLSYPRGKKKLRRKLEYNGWLGC